MKLHEIISGLEALAPPHLQESYDNPGLIVGNPQQEITAALLCVDSTEEIIDEAVSKRCNLVIAHHPIVFSGLKKIIGQTYVERTIIKAIKNDVAVYAVHTNLDNLHNGVNAKICEKLGLTNTRILQPKSNLLMKLFTFVPNKHAATIRQAMFDAGAGMIGNYDECSFNAEGYGTFRGNEETTPFVGERGMQHRESETKVEVIFPSWLQSKIIGALNAAHPYEEVAYDIVALENQWQLVGAGMIGEFQHAINAQTFLRLLKEKMKTAVVRYTKPTTEPILKVALCGGAGSFLLNDAIAQGAQALVTADFKYHQFFDAENRILIADIGHYESEQFTPEIVADFLKKKFPTFAVHFSNLNTNPVNYF